MKSLKKTLVLLVVLSMLLSAISPVFAASFNDEIDEAYWEHANKLAAVGVIKGDEDGNFNATSNITRAEMAVIICKMAGMTEATAVASQNIPSVFADVKAGEWYTGWINLAVDNGMIAGFPDGTFRPNDPLTTNQAITLVVKALGKGEYVDQMGTWPGNYVQEAAKLGLTTKMVNTGSDVANRGNVAILAWEALQVGTWDVTSTTLDGEVRLSEADSLIIKYFKDFVAGSAKNDNFRVKLIEDAVVTKVGKTTSELGANQIILTEANDGSTRFDGERSSMSIAEYIDAEDEPKKGAKEATYTKDGEDVVAYVPAEIADVDGLVNKKVDVLFGADNEVALLYVTEDVADEAYVTAWDKVNNKITIAGKTYKVLPTAEVTVFDYEIGEMVEVEDKNGDPVLDDNGDPVEEFVAATDANAAITELVEDVLVVANNKEIFNRVLKAEFSLDSKDRIEKIDFVFSAADYTVVTEDGELKIVEDIVKKVTSSGVIKGFSGNLFADDVEQLMEDEEIRLVRDNAVADFDEIEEGDVLTIISIDDEATLVYASSTKATGSFTRGKNHTLTVDGNKYNTVLEPLVNIDGEFDEIAPVAERDDVYEFVGEDVELYINFMGEVVGVVGTTSGVGTTLGVVMSDAELDFDEEKEVSFLKVRIMTTDGKKATYKVYNEKSKEDIEAAEAMPGIDTWADACLTKGDLVVFTADSNRKIDADEIEVPESTYEKTLAGGGTETVVNKFDFTSNSDVEVVVMAADDFANIVLDESKNLMEDIQPADADEDPKDLKVNGSTIYLNVEMTDANDLGADDAVGGTDDDADELNKDTEVIKNGWTALVNGDNVVAPIAEDTNVYIFYKGTKVIYFVADFMDYQSSDAEYAVVTDISTIENTEEDKVWEVTLYQEGETLVYELDDADLRETIHEGDFVEYTVSDDVIDAINPMVIWKAMKDIKDHEAIEDEEGNALLASTSTADILNIDAEVMGQLVVDSIDEGWLVFSDAEDTDGDDKGDSIADVEICEDGYIIYNMVKGEMVEDIDDVIGAYVIGIQLDDDEGAEIFVIVK